MRLFRRSLLCLVVGVTAFGAAGWVLGPKPNWTVDLGEFDSPDFTEGQTNPTADEPIWVTLSHANGPRVDSIAAFHPKTGKFLKRLDAGEEFNSLNARRMSGGRLLTVAYKDIPEDHPKAKAGVVSYTEFAFNNALTDDPTETTAIDDTWFATDDARRAWRVDETKTGFRIAVTDVSTGAPLHALDCSREYLHFNREHYHVSSDARWIVVLETDRDPDRKPAGIDVWDVEKGILARTIYPPAWPARNARRRLWYRDFVGTDRLSYLIPTSDDGKGGGSSSEAWFDLKLGRHLDAHWSPPNPPQPNVGLTRHREVGGEDHWTAYDPVQRTAWHALFKDERQLTDWSPVRVPFVASGVPSTAHAFGTDRYGAFESGLSVWRVPDKQEFVAHTLQPVLQDGLSESVLEWLPEEWKSDDRPLRSYWNDGAHPSWLDIGLCGHSKDFQLRTDALLAIVELKEGKHQLQSWPLPPRDPKWPALGVAALCTATTWWVCARRY